MADNPFLGVFSGKTGGRTGKRKGYQSAFSGFKFKDEPKPPVVVSSGGSNAKVIVGKTPSTASVAVKPLSPTPTMTVGNAPSNAVIKPLFTAPRRPTLPMLPNATAKNPLPQSLPTPKVDWSKAANLQSPGLFNGKLAKATELFLSNTEKGQDAIASLTGFTERRIKQIDKDEQSKKISRAEADRRREQILKDTEWAGLKTDTKGNLKKAAGVGLGTAAEIAPIGIGAKAAKGATTSAKIASGARAGAEAAGLASVGSQLVNEGRIDPFRTGKDIALGAGIGGALPGASRLLKGAPPKKPTTIAEAMRTDKTLAEIQNAGGRPQTQKLLEDAHNAGDSAKVSKIISLMADDDPYKASMQSVFADDIAQASGKERKFVTTIKDSPKTSQEVREGIGGTYTPITNKETLAKADIDIAKDFEGAVSEAKRSKQYSTDVQARSIRLIDQLQQQGRIDDAIDVVEATAKRATASGQAVQILSAYNRLSPEGVLQTAQRGIEKAKAKNPDKYGHLRLTTEQADNLRNKAQQIKDMEPGEGKLQATRELVEDIERAAPTPVTKKITTLWKAGLLTGIKGAVAGNTVGNSANSLMNKLSDVPASAVDTALSAFTGRRSKLFTLKGYVPGLKEGFETGYKNFKAGRGSEEVGRKLDYQKVYFSKSPLGRAAQKYTDTVFNFYAASDRPFFHAALKNTLNEMALLRVRNEGFKGAAARAEAKRLVTSPPDDLIEEATQAAETAVFQNRNALGAALSGAKRGAAQRSDLLGAGAEIVLPFTGVPSAIATAVVNYTPTGAAIGAYNALQRVAHRQFDQAAQRKLSTALGKSITGTGLLWLGAQLTNSGQMTLGYPKDQAERERWEADGKQPYSILIGGKWRSLNYFGPVQAIMAVGGEYAKARENDASQVGALGSAISGGAAGVIGGSPLKGLQSGIEAIVNPAESGNYWNNLAGSVVPTLVKDIGNATDPFVRKPDNPFQAIQSRIPGWREGVPIKENDQGQIRRSISPTASLFDPFRSSQATNTPEQNIAIENFYKRYKSTNAEKRKVNAEISALVNDGEIYKATRKAQEWNDSIAGKFQGFRDRYANTDAYNPQWDEDIEDLMISDKPAAIKNRKKKED